MKPIRFPWVAWVAFGDPKGDFQDVGPKISNPCGRGQKKQKNITRECPPESKVPIVTRRLKKRNPPANPADPPDLVRGPRQGTSRLHAPGIRMTVVRNKLPQIIFHLAFYASIYITAGSLAKRPAPNKPAV